MKLDVPNGSTYYWNPYSPKYYTLVTSPTLSSAGVSDTDSIPDHHNYSFGVHDDDEYDLGWATISSVRSETTDAGILTTMERLPYRTLAAMLAVLENSPSLLLELCEKERGNVVSQLMAVLGGESCYEITRLAIENIERLAKNQSGCISLTRIFDAATPSQQQALSAAALVHFEDLVMHQYGNFVVSRVAQSEDPAVHDYIAAHFENPELLYKCVDNKFGSHVYEAFVKNAPQGPLFRVASVLLCNEEAIIKIATSKISNYPLQATLRQMLLVDSTHELSRWALEHIPRIVAGTQFAININRSLGFRATASKH